jgi:hypothetical protein
LRRRNRDALDNDDHTFVDQPTLPATLPALPGQATDFGWPSWAADCGGLPPRALRRVREFVEAHLEENVSIQALADTAGLSMYHLRAHSSSRRA